MVNYNSVDECRVMYTEFINNYERLVEMVVPRSAK